MSIWDTIKKGASSVTKTISHAVEKLDPELIQLKKDYAHLSGQYNGLRIQVQDEISNFEKLNKTYKTYAGLPGGLLITSNTMNMDDSRFNDFLKATTAEPPQMKASNYLPSDTTSYLDRQLGDYSSYTINGVYNFNNLNKEGWFSDSSNSRRPAILSHISTAFSVGSFSISSPQTLVDIALNIGTGGITGAIIGNIISDTYAYQIANNKLRHGIDELKSDLGTVRDAESELNSGINNLKFSTIDILHELNAIAPANFTWQLSPNDPDASFLAALHAAYTEYAIIGRIKLKWKRFHARNPSKRVPEFKSIVEYNLNPDYSIDEIEKFIDLVAEHTPSMAALQ